VQQIDGRWANETIREWARGNGDDVGEWEFACECHEPDCLQRVRLTLVQYDAARRSNDPIVAPDHPVIRARAAREWARELREESLALRNQARHQVRRSHRLHIPHLPRFGPYPERICAACGYGICVPDPPEDCPVCRSTLWRSR
jgi:hypothetical protein